MKKWRFGETELLAQENSVTTKTGVSIQVSLAINLQSFLSFYIWLYQVKKRTRNSENNQGDNNHFNIK